MTTLSPTPSGHSRSSSDPSADPPPAYSLTPNIRRGESTVEFGPQRPFQRAPPPLQVITPDATGEYNSPSAGAFSSSSSLGRLTPQATGVRVGAQPTGGSAFHAPPPRHPASSLGRSATSAGLTQSTPALPPRPMSDFAREFYQAGVEAPAVHIDGADDAPTPSPSGQYAPPPGAPPRAWSPPLGAPASRGARSEEGETRPMGTAGLPDDGRPTSTPVPGHPLLRDGRILVYPAGYECRRCHNTGYRSADPSNPCHKCWGRHARPYVGAITYTPFASPSSSSPTSSGAGLAFQRPLPVHRPPQASLAPAASLRGDYPGALTLARARTVSDGPPLGLGLGYGPPGRQLTRGLTHLRGASGPPAGAAVVQPGDPRIGGVRCWRCGGDGWVTMLLFDRETCPACGGVGRVF